MTADPTIVGLGEVLWDELPAGAQFGGAPANFACHAAMLGGKAFMVSQVGRDPLGDQAFVELRRCGVNVDHVSQIANFPTGRVKVQLDAAGQPTYEFIADVAWDHLSWHDDFAALASAADAVCFGTLGQRSATSRDTIQRFVVATRPGCLRVFDVNLRQQFFTRETVLSSLGLANVLKLNDEELPVVAEICGLRRDDPAAPEQLRTKFNLQLVALTRGSAGAALFTSQGKTEAAAPPVTVVDSVGAGDSFTAALVLGLLAQRNLDDILRQATRVAAYVCTQHGATPTLPAALRAYAT